VRSVIFSETGRTRRNARIGLAIGADRIMAVRRRGAGGVDTQVLEAPLMTRPGQDGGWPELEEALRGLLNKLELRSAFADVALVPPLSQAKCVSLPPVAPSQLDPLIRRNLRRYFAVPFSVPLGRARPTEIQSGRVVRALALCADGSMIASLCECAESAGLTVTSMTSAPVALAEGLRRVRPRRGRLRVTWGARGWSGAMEIVDGVTINVEDWSNLPIRTKAQRLAQVREIRDDDENPTLTVALRGQGGYGDGSDVLTAIPSTRTEPGPDRVSESDPWILAAMGAARRGHQAPSLLPGTTTVELHRQARHRAWSLWACAAAMVLLAVGIHGYGLSQELAAVRSARARIAPQVTAALEIRRGAYAVNDRLEAIERIEDETLRWTPALAALTEVLPRSTYLVSLTTQGLSMRLGGVTRSSETIVPELEDSPLFEDVTLGNVRAAAGTGLGGAGTEFDLSLALRPSHRMSPPGEGGQP